MSEKNISVDFWYTYVLLCEDRKLFSWVTKDVEAEINEQLSKGLVPTGLKINPLCLIKKFKYKLKMSAIKKKHLIGSLKGKKKEEFILSTLLKSPKKDVAEVYDDKMVITCKQCKHINTIFYSGERELKVKSIRFKCLHELIKERIDSLFEQAILGAECFEKGKFIFEGKKSEVVRDYMLGFNSDRQHRKRTDGAHLLIEEISFKNSYLLLSAIMEESFYLIKEHAKNNNIKFANNYKDFSFQPSKNALLNCKKIRFCRIADFVRLSANVLKHSGGIIKDDLSGRQLIERFNLKENTDLCLYMRIHAVDKICIGDITDIILKVYVFTMDMISELFGFKSFRVRAPVLEDFFNYETSNEFKSYLIKIQR